MAWGHMARRLPGSWANLLNAQHVHLYRSCRTAKGMLTCPCLLQLLMGHVSFMRVVTGFKHSNQRSHVNKVIHLHDV